MTLYRWSRTADLDATADPSINWQEGQAPSTVNDSARAMMAAVAKYRDDAAGAILTSGTSTAYTVSSNQVFATLAYLHGQMIAFVPHLTNGATVSLNVDGLGAKPLRSAPSTDLLAGVLIAGTPYTCTYNNSDGAFYLRGFHVSPYSVPLGGGLPYFGSTAPNSAFAFPYGQAISRTTYQSLFALIGTTYGSSDGSTFNLPDLRGRVCAGRDDMGGTPVGRLTSTQFGANPTVLGAGGGTEKQALGLGHIPTSITAAGAVSGTFTSTQTGVPLNATGGDATTNGGGAVNGPYRNGTIALGAVTGSITGTASVTSNNTGANAAGGAKDVPTVQPTIICNYILRVI